ncbi:MAG: hypothetical protein QXQ96_05085 [Sulfolobales archaeon]
MISMGFILILNTHFNPSQWEKDGEVHYQGTSIDEKLLQEIRGLLPIPAIGIYGKGPIRRGTRTDRVDYTSLPPSFLVVDDVVVNDKGEPTFRFRRIAGIEGVQSKTLLSKLRDWPLYYLTTSEKVMKILEELGIKPPSEWAGYIR